ncbi:MAG: hypothetical protein GXC76_15335 [Rhodanobacteraceae bacterium]|jgi:hypothetical protein|nr:hypothetical protein [Rhodanobacteraceae bacterium]
MESRITQVGEALRIDTPVPLAGRLFGLPFVLVGGWLLNTLGGSIGDVVRGDAGVGEMLPGQLFLLLMSAAFLLPGLALVLTQHHAVLDRVHDSVAVVRRFLFVRHTRQRRLGAFARVRVAERIKREKEGADTVSYDIELVGPREDALLLGLADSPAAGRRLAAEIARYLALPDEARGSQGGTQPRESAG